MKKLIASVITTGVLLMSSTGASVSAHADFKELDRLGVELKHYVVTAKSGQNYIAATPNGKKVKFNQSDTPDNLKVSNRVRAYYQDGDLLTIELVKPIDYEQYTLTKITKNKKGIITSYTAYSKKEGYVQFTRSDVKGKLPKLGNRIIVEYDPMYIESGLMNAYVFLPHTKK